MFDLAGLLANLRREALVIKGAPISFLTVCLLMGGAIWYTVHSSYKGKLDDAHDEAKHWQDTANRWQSDASYYQDMVKRSVSQGSAAPKKLQAPTPKPTKNTTPDTRVKPPADISKLQISAPNGVAIGGNNNGSASVTNNYGPVQRVLTVSQGSVFLSKLGKPPADGFDGIYCIMGDQEGHQYAEQIREAFKQQGWNVGKMVGQEVLTQNVSGIFVAVSPEDASAPPDGVMRAYAALRAAGIEVKGLKMNGVQKGHWYIFVGNAPVKR